MYRTIRFEFRGRVYKITLALNAHIDVYSYKPLPKPLVPTPVKKKKVRRYTSRGPRILTPSNYLYCGKCGRPLTAYAIEHYGGFCKSCRSPHGDSIKVLLVLPVTEPRYGRIETENLARGAP